MNKTLNNVKIKNSIVGAGPCTRPKTLNKFLFVLLISFFLLQSVANALDKDFELKVTPKEIMPGRQAELSLRIKTAENIPEPDMPFIDGLLFRYKGKEVQGSIVDGQKVTFLIHKFTASPLIEKKFIIGPIIFSYGPDRYISNEEVLTSTRTPSPHPVAANVPIAGNGPISEDDIDKHIFLEVDVPAKAYQNQIIRVSTKFYTDWLDVENLVISDPPIDTIIQDKYISQDTVMEEMNGINYAILNFSKKFFSPEPGKILFGPVQAKFDLLSLKAEPLNDNEGFYRKFLGKKDHKPLTITSDTYTVEILPLPKAGRPDSFKGAIGDFRIGMSIEPSEVDLDDIVEMTVRVTGDGNFRSVNVPDIIAKDGLTVYDPSVTRGDDEAIIRYLLKITSQDVTVIRGVKFTYFDPKRDKYNTISTRAAKIIVKAPETEKEASKEPVKETLPADDKKNDKKKQISSGIKIEETKGLIYIKSSPGHLVSGRPLVFQEGFLFILFLLPLFVILAVFIANLRADRLRSDKVFAGWYHAGKIAGSGIHKAKTLLAKNKGREFYDHVFRFLQEYMGLRFSLPHDALTEQGILMALKDKVDDDVITAKIKDVFFDCYKANYTQDGPAELDMGKTFKDVKYIINFMNDLREL